MKKIRQEKGITLVALIITIIILLIIATVTIMSLDGEDGIIGKSKQAKTDYEEEQEKEKGIFAKFESMLAGEESSEGETSEDNGENDSSSDNLGDNSSEEEQNPNIASYIEGGVPIPVGFKYITGEKDTGVVVQNEADGSEFVWVPVMTTIAPYGLGATGFMEPYVSIGPVGRDDLPTYLNIMNNILGTTYTNSDEFLITLQNDFNAMADSVNKNKGFYVGRYETSLYERKARSVKGELSATAEESSANTWYGLYSYQKAYSTDSVQGSMIWGSQYNAMMTWMGNEANKEANSKKNTDRRTGTKETDKINNVYDLRGNSIEWTLEVRIYSESEGGYRVPRGGSYHNSTSKPSHHYGTFPSGGTHKYMGSRLALYIK